MKKRWRILIVGSLFTTLCVGAYQYFGRSVVPRGPEPIYKGRPVRDWVSEIWFPNATRNPHIEEVAAIGERAGPYLIKQLEDPRPAYARSGLYLKFWQIPPQWLQGHLAEPRP